jgi:hypothetical protein
MPAGSDVRIPLQTGATALRTLAKAPVGAGILGGLAALTLCGNGRIVDLLADTHHSPVPAIVATVVACLVGVAAYGSRATEAVVGLDGITLEAGATHVPWHDVTGVRVEDHLQTSKRVGREHVDALERTVVLERGSGEPIPVAAAVDVGEDEMLGAVADALRGAWGAARARDSAPVAPAAPAPSAEPAPPHHADLVICSGCGAAIAPADEPVVTCPFCQTEVAMPEPLRRRINSAARTQENDRLTDTLVADLLRQPSTARVNAWLAAVAVAHGAIGLAYWAFAKSQWNLGIPLLFAGLLVLLHGLARRRVADRIAIGALVRAAARAPEKPGGPRTCHSCGAPLPAPPKEGSIVLACAYCSAQNVLGLDAVAGAGTRSVGAVELAEAIARRDAARRGAVGRIGVGGVVMVFGIVWGVLS